MEILKKEFENFKATDYNYLVLSGNSYGIQACEWVATNVIRDWEGLRQVSFSNMFVGRLRNEIP